MTSEHAYQAAHFMKHYPEIADEIFNSTSADQAKRIAKNKEDKFPKDWHKEKTKIMEDICRHKLSQHNYIKKKLLQTEDRLIIEDSPVDSFWGWGPDHKGRNELGKIWMKLREELKQNNFVN